MARVTLRYVNPDHIRKLVRLRHPLLPEILRIENGKLYGEASKKKLTLESTATLLMGLANYGFYFSDQGFNSLPAFPDLIAETPSKLINIATGEITVTDPWELSQLPARQLSKRWPTVSPESDLLELSIRRSWKRPTIQTYLPGTWHKLNNSFVLIPSHPDHGFSTSAEWFRHDLTLRTGIQWLEIKPAADETLAWKHLCAKIGLPDDASLQDVRERLLSDYQGYGMVLDHMADCEDSSRPLFTHLILSLPDLVSGAVIGAWDQEKIDGFAWIPLPTITWEKIQQHIFFPHLTPLERASLSSELPLKRGTPASFVNHFLLRETQEKGSSYEQHRVPPDRSELENAALSQNALKLLSLLPELDTDSSQEILRSLAYSLKGDVDTFLHILTSSEQPDRVLPQGIYCLLEGNHAEKIAPFLKKIPPSPLRSLYEARIAFLDNNSKRESAKLEAGWDSDPDSLRPLIGIHLADRVKSVSRREIILAEVKEQIVEKNPWIVAQYHRFTGTWNRDGASLQKWLGSSLKHGWLAQVALAYSDLAAEATFRNEWMEAHKLIEKALRYRSVLGSSISRSLLLYNMGVVQIHLERPGRAAEIFLELAEEHRSKNAARDLIYDLYQLATIHYYQGEFSGCSEKLGEIAPLMEQNSDHPLAAWAVILQAETAKWEESWNPGVAASLDSTNLDPDTRAGLSDLNWQIEARLKGKLPHPESRKQRIEAEIAEHGWKAGEKEIDQFLSENPLQASMLVLEMRKFYPQAGSVPEDLKVRIRDTILKRRAYPLLHRLSDLKSERAWSILRRLREGEPFYTIMPAGTCSSVEEENLMIGVPREAPLFYAAVEQYYKYPEEFWRQASLHAPPLIRKQEPASSRAWQKLIYQSDKMEEVVREASMVADLPIPILITGETGTGKEILALSVHAAAGDPNRPFMAVNCASIPPDLFESELFGHKKGAFTGAAADKPGLIELSDGGTLFLDEVGELPLSAQAKLLRVLNDHRVQRLGDHHQIEVSFRLITATHRDLEQMAADGMFREDFYYRIKGMILHMPPLKERTEEIPLLAGVFLERFCRECCLSKKTLSDACVHTLAGYEWPGNVRELQSVIQVAAARARDREILNVEDLPAYFKPARSYLGRFQQGHDEKTVEMIVSALKQAGGSRKEAAKLLGITPQALGYHIRRLNIKIS